MPPNVPHGAQRVAGRVGVVDVVAGQRVTQRRDVGGEPLVAARGLRPALGRELPGGRRELGAAAAAAGEERLAPELGGEPGLPVAVPRDLGRPGAVVVELERGAGRGHDAGERRRRGRGVVRRVAVEEVVVVVVAVVTGGCGDHDTRVVERRLDGGGGLVVGAAGVGALEAAVAVAHDGRTVRDGRVHADGEVLEVGGVRLDQNDLAGVADAAHRLEVEGDLAGPPELLVGRADWCWSGEPHRSGRSSGTTTRSRPAGRTARRRR